MLSIRTEQLRAPLPLQATRACSCFCALNSNLLPPAPSATAVLQDAEVLPLIRDGAVWTMGLQQMDIDYEAVWRHRLANDNYKALGMNLHWVA